MFNVVLELVVSFAQMFSTIVSIPEINFPESWKVPIKYVAALNIGLETFSSWFPALNDIRVYFMVLSVVGPLVFVMLGLLSLNEKRVVLWYLVVVMGVMVTLAGALGSIIAATTDFKITADDAQMLLYIGVATLFLTAVVFFVNKRCTRDDTTEVKERVRLMDEETLHVNWFSTIQSFVITVAAVVFGGLCWGVGTTVVQDQLNTVADMFSEGLSGLAALVAIVFFVWFCMGLIQAGRRKQWAFTTWFESGFLRVFLLSISLAYIPIGAGVFLMFNCNTFSCPSGSRLPDDGSAIYSNTSVSTTDYCVPCTAGSGQVCPSSLLSTMCATSSDERLEYSLTTECSTVRPFFWPAAGLIILMFVLGVPIMFYSLIEISSSALHDLFPVKDIKPPANSEEDFDPEVAKWHKQVVQSKNVAKFLFSPFQYKFRYVRLFLILQKLFIVGTTSYVIRNTPENPQTIALACSVAIHCLAFMLLSYHRPFVAKFEARLAILMSLFLTTAAVIGVLLIKGVEIPTGVMYAVIAVNGLLPAMAIVFGLYLEWSSGKADDDALEKEARDRMEKEMNAKAEEERKQEEQAMAASQKQSAPETFDSSIVTITPIGQPSDGQDGPAPAYYNPSLRMGASTMGASTRMAATTSAPSASVNFNQLSEKSMDKSRLFRVPQVKETHEERRRRIAKQMRQQREASLKVRDELQREALKLNDAQGDVDLFIDRSVKSQLQMFLMIGGVIGAVALSLCIIGLIAREYKLVDGPFPSESTTESELAGYPSWDAFRYNCCCTTNTNPAAGGRNRLIEKWICMNGRIKERVRSIDNGDNTTSDGFSVRSYCSVSFAVDCSLTVDSDNKVSVSCLLPRNQTELTLW